MTWMGSHLDVIYTYSKCAGQERSWWVIYWVWEVLGILWMEVSDVHWLILYLGSVYFMILGLGWGRIPGLVLPVTQIVFPMLCISAFIWMVTPDSSRSLPYCA
jgi:hypothetical protein